MFAVSADSKVSVIIAAHNCAGTLKRAFDSAWAQFPPPLEVIIINDGSTDQTAAVAQALPGRRVYLEQKYQGRAVARNTGVRLAKGEFIAFLNPDGYWRPGFFSACLAFLEQCPKAVAVSTGLGLKRWKQPPVILPEILAPPNCWEAGALLLTSFFTFWGEQDHLRTGSVLIRKQIIQDAGPQQPHLWVGEDSEYWAYLATLGRWGFIPEIGWVGDPEEETGQRGKPRRLCPTVEQWEERIVPRLQPEDWPGFTKVRGRVAATLAHTQLLAGKLRTARQTIAKYGHEMPPCRPVRVMRRILPFGAAGYLFIYFLLSLRETRQRLTRRSSGAQGQMTEGLREFDLAAPGTPTTTFERDLRQ